MTLDDYAEFGLFDVGLQLVRLQSYLEKFGIETRIDVYNVALFVYASKKDSMTQKSPVFEIYFDVETYDVSVLSLKTCGDYTIHPYLSWLWANLSIEMKASMMRFLLDDPENGPKVRACNNPT
ncbi:MAG: hypothetical protein MJY82_01400 [Fibrobacter sp.]|nr:hypothetical protein [Fibrobacter sp.]